MSENKTPERAYDDAAVVVAHLAAKITADDTDAIRHVLDMISTLFADHATQPEYTETVLRAVFIIAAELLNENIAFKNA